MCRCSFSQREKEIDGTIWVCSILDMCLCVCVFVTWPFGNIGANACFYIEHDPTKMTYRIILPKEEKKNNKRTVELQSKFS